MPEIIRVRKRKLGFALVLSFVVGILFGGFFYNKLFVDHSVTEGKTFSEKIADVQEWECAIRSNDPERIKAADENRLLIPTEEQDLIRSLINPECN